MRYEGVEVWMKEMVEMRLKELGICGWRHGRKEWGFKGCDTDKRTGESRAVIRTKEYGNSSG